MGKGRFQFFSTFRKLAGKVDPNRVDFNFFRVPMGVPIWGSYGLHRGWFGSTFGKGGSGIF